MVLLNTPNLHLKYTLPPRATRPTKPTHKVVQGAQTLQHQQLVGTLSCTITYFGTIHVSTRCLFKNLVVPIVLVLI